jgi:AraC-like DNA-binding protein
VSSSTINALLPPSSSDTRFSVCPATAPTSRPTVVEPVNEIIATWRSSTSAAPGSASPGSTCSRPSGSPASSNSLATSAPPDTDAATPDESSDALRLQVLGYVRAHLADPHLSHGDVAAAHHMAGRTLHRLFEHEPFTVTDYIRVQRLAAVHRDLTDPLLRNRSIAAIAARWGFTDQAHFTRAFRAR